MDGKRPKMLRQTGKELANIKCVSAKVVFDKIVLENCSQHPPPPDDGPPVMKQVLDKMSNLILNEQNGW